jgi:dihydrofolate reductase
MGRKTAVNLCEPLPDRDNIVVSSKDDLLEGFIVVRTFDEALKRAEMISRSNKEIFVIGGSRLFNMALDLDILGKIYYTHINKSFKCDNFVKPILDRDDYDYTILETKTVWPVDNLNAINLVGKVNLTFYLITCNR